MHLQKFFYDSNVHKTHVLCMVAKLGTQQAKITKAVREGACMAITDMLSSFWVINCHLLPIMDLRKFLHDSNVHKTNVLCMVDKLGTQQANLPKSSCAKVLEGQ